MERLKFKRGMAPFSTAYERGQGPIVTQYNTTGFCVQNITFNLNLQCNHHRIRQASQGDTS